MELLKALAKQNDAEIARALANIVIYTDHPAGIGEHPDLVEAVDTQVQALANADEKLKTLKEYYDITI